MTGETTVEKPVVYGGTAGEASGQVLNSKTITLTCDTNYTSPITPTYVWKKDGSDDSSLGTSQTTTITVDSATFGHTYA